MSTPQFILCIFDPDARKLRDGDPNTGLIHRCYFCGKRDRWNDDWSWYGKPDEEHIAILSCGCIPEDARLQIVEAQQKQEPKPDPWF
jgi:hypothetical protein